MRRLPCGSESRRLGFALIAVAGAIACGRTQPDGLDQPAIATDAGAGGAGAGGHAGTGAFDGGPTTGGDAGGAAGNIVVAHIEVTPSQATVAVGQTEDFAAFYVDDTGRSDVTSVSTWTVGDPKVASLDSAGAAHPGRALGLATGTTSVRAQLKGLTASAVLSVEPSGMWTALAVAPANLRLGVGQTASVQALATQTSGAMVDVSGMASWSCDNTSICKVDVGSVTAIAAGRTNVTVAFAGLTATALVTVSANNQGGFKLSIDPLNATSAIGKIVMFTATATFGNGATQDMTANAAWRTSDPRIAIVTTAGDVQCVASGTVNVSAMLMGQVVNTALSCIASDLAVVRITPAMTSVPLGTRLQFYATAYFANGSSLAVTSMATWSSSDASIVDVSDARGTKGAVTARAAGTATITAAYQGASGDSMVTVTGK